MRLTLVIFKLAGGGAERVLSRIANHWAEDEHMVTVVTVESPQADFYALDPRVRRMSLDLAGNPTTKTQRIVLNVKRLRALRRALRTSRPEVAFSFVDKMNLLMIAAARGMGIPVVVSERTDPVAYRVHFPMKMSLEIARRVLYRHAARVVVQTGRARGWALEFLSPERVSVIPNPVDLSDRHIATASAIEIAPPTVISAGRMNRQKGFDLLIEAFSRCAEAHPKWNLVILGDGPDREVLAAIAERLGIAERVAFPGAVAGSIAIFGRAQVFVLPSRVEGFPNVLLEAMAAGLPAVSFDCPSGPADIIDDGINGLLVPPEDVNALAATLDRLMSDEAERARLGAAATGVLERFSLTRVMAMWDGVITDVLAARP